MINIIKNIFSLISSKDRSSAYWCFAAMLLMGFFDVIGVASIMPFIAVISDPEAISHHKKLTFIYHYFNFISTNRFLIFLGFLVLGILIIGNGISMLTTWLIMKFTYTLQYHLSKKLFIQYMHQPYTFFIHRHSSELSKNILSEVITVINRAFIPGMQLISKVIVTAFILILLLIIDPVLAFVMIFMLGGTYIGIYVKVRGKLADISKRCLKDNQYKYKIVTEALNGIKDIKLLGREKYFIESFSFYAQQHADDEATGNIIAHLPRYVLETIAFSGILVIIIYLLMMKHNVSNAMPLLALYAFAAYRLMPAMQQIFTSISFLRLSKDALAILASDLHHDQATHADQNYDTIHYLPFNTAMTLRDIHFTYPVASKPIIQGLNLTILVHSTIGIVGMTGAGKSTMVDLILGLLTPDQGEIFLDQTLIVNQNITFLQKKMGYVPQSIFIADDTVTNNIAFGIRQADINMQAIEHAARLANIHQFIINDLENGYNTIVGDRGIRLSGGQRQRIGIARALYHDPDILILDEATSSLDTITEDGIIEAIRKLSRHKTIIIIAHRLSTLIECDVIHVLEEGKIISSNNYHELLKSCVQFKNMARIN